MMDKKYGIKCIIKKYRNSEIEIKGTDINLDKHLDLFKAFCSIGVESALLYYGNGEATYFERGKNCSVFVVSSKENIGFAKLYVKRIIYKSCDEGSISKSVDVGTSNKISSKRLSLDEAFELAEKIEKMDLDEFIKFQRGGSNE